MLNMVNIYHIRDSYDHSRGYGHNNTYTNAPDDVIKELIAKHERYLKGNDIGGYWIQVTSYEVGQTPTVVDHIKVVPQKTRIELNVKAKREGKRKSVEDLVNGFQMGVAINAFAPAPPVAPIINNIWADEAPVPEQEALQVAQQEEWL